MSIADPSSTTSAAAPRLAVATSGATQRPASTRWKRRAAIAAVVVAAIAAVAWWLLPTHVEAVTVEQRDFAQTVVATGHVEAPHRVSIAAQVVGSVDQVPVGEGQTVAAGDPLVMLDARELRAAADQAESAVEQARLRLRSIEEVQRPVAEQALRQAQVSLDNARAARQRTSDLFAQGFVGQAALDDVRKAADLAEAQVVSARKQLEALERGGSEQRIAEAALTQARAAAETAQARLRYTRIVAPTSGVLIARDVERGDVVQPGKPLMTLSPSGETQLVVQIDERNLARVQLGQAARASADAFADRRFAAEVVYINPGIDAQRGSVEVKLRVAEPPPYLRQDMTVSVDIEVARRPHALLVPLDALRDTDTNPWVLQVEDGVARRRDVRIGLRGNGYGEVLAGLAAGDRIVPPSATRVHAGVRVRVAAAGT